MENLNLHIISPNATNMRTEKTNPTRENPKDFLVSKVGKWSDSLSSMISKSQSGGLKVKGESIQRSVISSVVNESGGTSFEASSAILPNIQLNAISPTVFTLWNVGRP